MIKVINSEKVRQMRRNLARIYQDHPELTTLGPDDAQSLRKEILSVTVDEIKTTFMVDEVAEILGVHAETIRNWIKAGKLKAAKTGNHYRISLVDLEALWKSMGGETLLG